MSVDHTILAIDTAAPRLQLALLRADGPAELSIDDIAKGHAEMIFARIDALLTRNGLAYADLSRIAVTTGPGSFTGLRIGLSAAHGLGLALEIPVIGIPSLLAISLSGEGPLAVLVDARRDEGYIQRFSAPGVPLDEAAILPIGEAEALAETMPTIISSPFVDIEKLARFALAADPADYPPSAAYVRGPDAKPQEKARIARVSP
jgi:tRNA threonylcarbamoyladenosine biosynthesis protein TsaB